MRRHTGLKIACFFAVAGSIAGCSEQKLGGELEVNGQKTSVASCRFGQQAGEQWVEVTTPGGYRIRVAERQVSKSGTSTKKETVVLVAQSQDPALAEAKCQTKFTSSSTINGRRSGSVSLGQCRTQRIVVSGKFTFGQCATSV